MADAQICEVERHKTHLLYGPKAINSKSFKC
jgi:hypothetical protein